MIQMCAGIDYSMQSPGICIHPMKPVNKFSDCHVFFYTGENKYVGTFGEHNNIHGMRHLPYESQMERFDNIAEWTLAILQKYNVQECCIEGYAMGSSKGVVFNIGENGGILKHKLWQNEIEFITPAPTTVKKCFAGKGNAKKEDMLEAFTQRFDVDLKATISYTRKTVESPLGDIVDSVAMVDYLITNKI